MPSNDHPGRVLLAFPSTGHDISTRFLRSMWELDLFDRHRGLQAWEALGEPEHPNPVELRILHNYVAIEATANLAKARNRLVDEFLHNPDHVDCDWLWFCDTDMVYEPDLLHRMVARAVQMDVKILGALCVIITAEGPLPTLFVDDPTTITQIMLDWEPNQVCEVAATGTGCLLIHRSVLQDMLDRSGGSKNCWFGFDIHTGDTGVEWALGEDVSFCLRAREAGHKVYVDTTAQVGHHKGVKVWWPQATKDTPAQITQPNKTVDENAHA
jgi:hypothetical protein